MLRTSELPYTHLYQQGWLYYTARQGSGPALLSVTVGGGGAGDGIENQFYSACPRSLIVGGTWNSVLADNH